MEDCLSYILVAVLVFNANLAEIERIYENTWKKQTLSRQGDITGWGVVFTVTLNSNFAMLRT